MNHKKILILNGQYAPGYKGGGPIQSCINMVENLYEYYDFYVLCADRDYKEKKAYNSVKINEWNDVGNAKVFYMSPQWQSIKGFSRIINQIDYDILYLNGFFSPIFTIRPLILRKLKKIPKKTVILTPRGDFTGGCENKKIKKNIYIFLVKLLGIYNNLLWHATSEIEDKDIKKKFPQANSFMVPNLPIKFVSEKMTIRKNPGELKLVFISRIFPKKNIKYALNILKQIKNGIVSFDIYGPLEDKSYWLECTNLIKNMPDNVKVNYCGEIVHNDVAKTFRNYHAFFFPTLGENYGHVIVEAMMNNCLCILSKNVTPWEDYIEALNMGAHLDEPDKFVEIINYLVFIDSTQMDKLLKYTTSYILKKTELSEIKLQFTNILNNSINNT